jgi:diguanylate cyclase (GGDEF)-like protein/putative nucleotidyltransferase with HDIG domain
VWHDNFLCSITSYVVGGLTAAIAVEVFHRAGDWQTALAIIPLWLTYRSYRIYLKRMDEQQRIAEWTQLHRESTEVLARAIQAKDNGGSCHVERVQYYAVNLARHLRLPALDVQAVEIAALLHDIGKLAVPEHILSKPGPLTANERRKMEIHAQVGAEIVGAVPFPCPVAPLIRSHHERWDGTGYPAGLRGSQIPLGARILSVVDCYDALTSDRPYRQALSPYEATRMLKQGAGKAFDPHIVAQFAALLPQLTPPTSRDRDPASLVAGEHQSTEGSGVNSDAYAKIASANRESYTLYEIAQSMGRSMSLAETMTLVTSKLSALIPFSSCALFVRTGDDELRCRFATGTHAAALEAARLAEGQGLSGWVARHRRPLVNGMAAAEFIDAGIAPAGESLQSALVCPLIVGEQLIGTIAVYHPDTHPYTDDHRRVLDEVSNQAASVVHNALLFEQTQEQAFKDGLTGLANARALQFQVTRELGRARRTGSQFSLLLLDLDEFKSINDEHGHLNGDSALREVARVLRLTTRAYDTCIRYGGDEFVILLPDCGREEAELRGRALQDAVARISLEGTRGSRIPLRVSVGASAFPEDGETYERLLAKADQSMYRDKAERKAQANLGALNSPPPLALLRSAGRSAAR